MTDYSDDFSTNKMTYSGTTFSYNGSAKEQDFTLLNTLNADQSYVDMLGGTISDTKWILRFKITWSTFTVNTTASVKIHFVGIFSTNSDMTTSQDGIYFDTDTFSSVGHINIDSCDGAQPNLNTDVNVLTTTPSATTYWVEIKRLSATSVKITLYSDSTYTTVVETKTITIPSTIQSLRYLQSSARSGSVNGTVTGLIDDVQFWNNTTIVPVSLTDALTITETVSKNIAKSISDSISLSGEKVNKSINKTISDTLSISDSVHVNIAQSISDNILTTDTVSISKTIIRSVVDNLSAGDIISKSLGKQINDSPSLSDVLSKNINKILTDNLSLVDIISKSITKLIVENPSFLDSTGQSRTLIRNITDALSILESTVISKGITKQIIDNLSSGDSISKNIGKLLQDNPTLAEQLSKAINKIITDNISIPDSVTKNIGSLLLNQTRRINLNNTTQQTIAEGKPRNVTI